MSLLSAFAHRYHNDNKTLETTGLCIYEADAVKYVGAWS